jgi:hypothetical protein
LPTNPGIDADGRCESQAKDKTVDSSRKKVAGKEEPIGLAELSGKCRSETGDDPSSGKREMLS